MKRSNKGFTTKYNILSCAKELFYLHGYKKTTVTEICNIADVKLGTFTYYFKTKEALVEEIYAEYLMKVYTYVSFIENRRMDSLEKNTISTFLYYRIIFDDPNNVRFHYEVLQNISIFTFLEKNLRRIYANFVTDFDLEIGKKELIRISSADLGVRRELTLEFIEKNSYRSSTDLITTIYIMMGRLFKIDQNIMIKYISRAIRFQKKNDYSSIKFLSTRD